MKLELFWPTEGKVINQIFGVNGAWYQEHGLNIIGHNGTDFQCVHGEPIRASHDGVVTFAGEDGMAGSGVVIRTNEKREYNGGETYFKTIYWHLIPQIPVKAGQQVGCGDIIGYGDNTGLSTGDHLHFGLKPVLSGEADYIWYNLEQNNGYLGAIDPKPFFGNLTAKQFKDTLTLINQLKAKVADLWKSFELWKSTHA